MLQVLIVGGSEADRKSLQDAVWTRVVAAKRSDTTVEWPTGVDNVEAARLAVVIAFEDATDAELSQVDAHPTLQYRILRLRPSDEASTLPAATLGLKRGPDWSGRLADRILRFLEIDPRRRPRVFISYRQADGQTVAAQLENHLTGCGFRVFQDRRDLEVGDDLRAEIRQNLADTDLLLRLRTPKAPEDPGSWMQWEAETATLLGVGALQVVWPGCTAFSSVRSVTLTQDDLLNDGSLHPSATDRVQSELSFELSSVLTFRRARLAEGLLRIARSMDREGRYDIDEGTVDIAVGHAAARGLRPGRYRPLPGLPGSRAYARVVKSKELALVDGAACSTDDGHELWLQDALLQRRVLRIDLLAETHSRRWVVYEESRS